MKLTVYIKGSIINTSIVLWAVIVVLISKYAFGETPYMSHLQKTDQEHLIWGQKSEMDGNRWVPICWTVVGSCDTIKVDLYGEIGNHLLLKCTAIFESSTQFKLIAPWIPSTGLMIQKANISSIHIRKE